MEEKVLFLGLKNGGNRVLFSNLAWGGAAVAPPTPPGLAPPPLRARPAAPALAPWRPRGLPVPLRGEEPPSCPSAPARVWPAPTARPSLRRPSPAPRAPHPGRPGARGAQPGPQRARLRLAARLLGRPELRPAAHPGRLQTWLPALHNPLLPPSLPATRTRAPQGKDPGGRGAQSLLFPTPTAFPGRPRAPADSKELIPARSLPPQRPPAFPVRARELRSSPRRGRRTRGPGPAGGHHYMQVIGGRGRPKGVCLQLPGSGSSAPGQFSKWEASGQMAEDQKFTLWRRGLGAALDLGTSGPAPMTLQEL
ncbi:hemogen isoform X3 [Odocoileus virginianus]|uniref:Hemogen isoform X3 n=1 Tax=Odocoileus virginianus TaxID=9874 RepID=A0ABM4J8A7_ODOVR